MRINRLRRREFITLLGSSAVAPAMLWPVVASAQQGERMRRIGVLMHTSADEPESQARLAAFVQGLQESGWAVGRNLRIDYRWSVGDADRRRHAAELVALSPDVILATSGAIVGALQEVSRSVPIVFVTVIDPVGGGWYRFGGYAGQQELAVRIVQAMGVSLVLFWMAAPRLTDGTEVRPTLRRYRASLVELLRNRTILAMSLVSGLRSATQTTLSFA